MDPRSYKVPDWFLNRRKDIKDGKYGQLTASALATRLRDDFERLKKIRWVGVEAASVCCDLQVHNVDCIHPADEQVLRYLAIDEAAEVIGLFSLEHFIQPF